MLRTLILALAAFTFTSAAAGAADYGYDPAHTKANFTAIHLAIIKVHGAIPLKSGSIVLGPNDMPTAATAIFDVSAINSDDENRDRSLRNSYLETDKYPTMTFVMRKITGSPQAFEMTGDLTLHGVTKPVTLKGSIIGASMDHGKREVGYSATTTLDRRDFGITLGTGLTDAQLSVGYPITVEIEAAVEQQQSP